MTCAIGVGASKAPEWTTCLSIGFRSILSVLFEKNLQKQSKTMGRSPRIVSLFAASHGRTPSDTRLGIRPHKGAYEHTKQIQIQTKPQPALELAFSALIGFDDRRRAARHRDGRYSVCHSSGKQRRILRLLPHGTGNQILSAVLGSPNAICHLGGISPGERCALH